MLRSLLRAIRRTAKATAKRAAAVRAQVRLLLLLLRCRLALETMAKQRWTQVHPRCSAYLLMSIELQARRKDQRFRYQVLRCLVLEAAVAIAVAVAVSVACHFVS